MLLASLLVPFTYHKTEGIEDNYVPNNFQESLGFKFFLSYSPLRSDIATQLQSFRMICLVSIIRYIALHLLVFVIFTFSQEKAKVPEANGVMTVCWDKIWNEAICKTMVIEGFLQRMLMECIGSTTVIYLFLARIYRSTVLRSNNALYWTSLLFPY